MRHSTSSFQSWIIQVWKGKALCGTMPHSAVADIDKRRNADDSYSGIRNWGRPGINTEGRITDAVASQRTAYACACESQLCHGIQSQMCYSFFGRNWQVQSKDSFRIFDQACNQWGLWQGV